MTILLIYSSIYTDVGGWVGLKKPKTWSLTTVPLYKNFTITTGKLAKWFALIDNFFGSM